MVLRGGICSLASIWETIFLAVVGGFLECDCLSVSLLLIAQYLNCHITSVSWNNGTAVNQKGETHFCVSDASGPRGKTL